MKLTKLLALMAIFMILAGMIGACSGKREQTTSDATEPSVQSEETIEHQLSEEDIAELYEPDPILRQGTTQGGAAYDITDGVLTISSPSDDYSAIFLDGPWSEYAKEITHVIIKEGVQGGSVSFTNLPNLTDFTIEDGVTALFRFTFDNPSEITVHCYENSLAYEYALEAGCEIDVIGTTLDIEQQDPETQETETTSDEPVTK